MNSSDVNHLFEDTTVRLHEREVDKLLTEMRDELDIANANGKPFKSISSVAIPKIPDFYKCELRNSILHSLKVSEVVDTSNISETFHEEHISSTRSENTLENLPLALLQFYVQQIHELMASKRSHLLRWKQFARHTKTIESSFPRFQERVMDVMNLWKNNILRCERLSAIREAIITSRKTAQQPPQLTFGNLSMVHVDDVLIYLRWMITNMSQMRLVQKYFTACQWVPQIYINDVSRAATKQHVVEGQSRFTEVPKFRRNSSAKSAFITEVPSIGSRGSHDTRSSVPTAPSGASTWGPLSRIIQTSMPSVGEGIDSSKHLLKYLIEFYSVSSDKDIDQLTTTADFAELFVIVNNSFPNLFAHQEEYKTFKVFDSVEEGWEVDSPKRAFLMKANWLEFVHYRPQLDAGYESLLTTLRYETKADELLELQCGFLNLTNPDMVRDTYRTYLRQVNDPDYIPRAARVLSNKTDANTLALWRKVYNSGSTTSGNNDKVEIWDLDENRLESNLASKHTKEKSNNFDPTSLLRLDNKSESESSDPGNLCVMLLRHLRIRDHQRSVLSVLNYFRSVERTIAIDSCGLISEEPPPIVSGDEVSQPPAKLKPTAFTPRQAAMSLGLETASIGLGQPHYIYNTPKDFALAEADFMEHDDIANHANFYVVKDGRVHVKDEKGYFVMYDVAVNDLKKLQRDIVLLASRFLAKSFNNPAQTTQMNVNEEILKLTNAPVDRMAVLYDFWTLEAEYQELKRELFDLYYEAYLNCFSRDIRLRLIQILVNIQHQRPKFSSNDGSTPTEFIQIYRLECEILRGTIVLVRDVFKAHIVHCREVLAKIAFNDLPAADKAGLPFPISLKQPVTIHLPKTAITSVDLLEFHNTVASVAQHLPGIIAFVTDEMIRAAKTRGELIKQLRVELFAIECLNKEWREQPTHGSTFSAKVQTDVIFDALADDPVYLTQLAKGKLAALEPELMGLTRNDQSARIYSSLCRVLDIVSVRHRLVLALYESEVLARCYKQFAKSLNFEPYHLYLRCLHLENAVKREHLSHIVQVPQPGAPDEDFMASGLDKFVASSMSLAVQEVDENHLPKFSLRQPASVKAMLDDAQFRRLQVTLTCQIAHKNLLTAACQMMYYVQDHLSIPRGTKDLPEDPKQQNKSQAESSSGFEPLSRKESVAPPPKAIVYEPPDHLPECFISVQLEKMTKRSFAHNWFVDGKIQLGFAIKNPAEFEKLVGNAAVEFSHMVTQRASIIGMKAHLIAYYSDILTILQDFPSIRDNFFQMGYAKEVKNKSELTRDYLKEEPLTFRNRPRTVFSTDGSAFMNLWFIPFPSEIHQSFLAMSDHDALSTFTLWLRIVASLHDVLATLAAFARMGVRSGNGTGGKHNVMPAAAASASSAEWGGAEGIGAELFDIQTQIAALENPSDPELVAQFLELRRRAALLSLDITIRYLMRDALLPHREDAYQGLVSGFHHSLPMLLGATARATPSVYQTDLTMPEPLECRDKLAKAIFCHRVHLNRFGPFPTAAARFHKIMSLVHGCFCRLERPDRQVLNGELMNLTLMTEELLRHAHSGYAHLLLGRDSDGEMYDVASAAPSVHANSRPSSSMSGVRPSASTIGATIHVIPNLHQPDQSLQPIPTKLSQPMLAYNLVCIYLRLWKQMEIFKDHFMKTRISVTDHRIGWTAETYEDALNYFCTERYTPMLTTIYNLFGNSELSLMLNFAKSSREILALPIPPTLSDLDCKAVQLAQLVQTALCNGFTRISKKLQRDFNLLLNEKAREEEDVLPNDLWKKPGIRENFTIAQPQLVELFTSELYAGIQERRDGVVVIAADRLNAALNTLASACMARERFCFESYSSYYEALLREYHRDLYSRERQIEALQSDLAACRENVNTAALEKMAANCRDLLLEVTSLRLRMSDAEAKQQKRDETTRLAVKADFSGLVDAVAAASLQLRSRFDAYRHRIAGETDELIKETKEQVLEKIRDMSGKAFIQQMANDPMDARAELEAEVSDLREGKRRLEALVSRMRAIDQWRITALTAKFRRQIEFLEAEINRIKCENCDNRLLSDEEVLLLRQQQVTLRKAVSLAEKETGRVKNQLEKEARTRQEREQALKEQMAAQEKSHHARTSTFDQVVTDLAERNVVVRQLAVELDARERVTDLDRHNATRDLRSARSQLVRERDLKQQAIGRLGELAQVVTEMDYIFTHQPFVTTPTRNSASPSTSVTRPSTGTVRQLSSAMAVQFAASRPPTSTDEQLEMAPEVTSSYPKTGLRPMTATAAMTRGRRPQTAVTSPSPITSLVPAKIQPAPTPAPSVTGIMRTRAKSARTDAVRFNILSDLEPPTFEQIRQLTRSTNVPKVENRQNAFS